MSTTTSSIWSPIWAWKSKAGCLKRVSPDGLLTDVDEIGSNILRVIIEYCRMKGVQKVFIEDASEYWCAPNYRIALAQAHVLTHGEPWYTKYGFTYENMADHAQMQKNKEIWQQKRGSDLVALGFLQELTKRVAGREEDVRRLGIDQGKSLVDIEQTLTLMTTQPIGDFFKWFQRTYCILFCIIYQWCFDRLGFVPSMDSRMSMQLRATGNARTPATRE